MRAISLLAATSALLSPALARITGFYAPATIAPDSTVSLLIQGEDYIQSVDDVAMSFGIFNSSYAYNGTLGTLLSSKYLGPDESNVVGNITHKVHVPCTQAKGDLTLTGALFSLYGARLGGELEYFAVNVTVGNFTDLGDYVFSVREEVA